MGLDITVHKLKKASKFELERFRYFRLVNNDGEFSNEDFPSWTKQFITTKEENWYDWNQFERDKNINLNDYNEVGESYSPDGENFMTIEKIDTKEKIKIDLNKVPTYNKIISIIGYEEVGYQRKGLNGKFYDDYDNHKIGYYVWDKKELERYKEDYCDSDDDKKEFQENIIDNFIEGECCVTFDW